MQSRRSLHLAGDLRDKSVRIVEGADYAGRAGSINEDDPHIQAIAAREWKRGAWNFWATITGDLGHQVQADSTLVSFGVKTRTKWAAELGNNFADNVEEIGDELALIKEVAERKGIPMELLIQTLPNATEMIAKMKMAAEGIPDEPPPPPGLIGTVDGQGGEAAAGIARAGGTWGGGPGERDQYGDAGVRDGLLAGESGGAGGGAENVNAGMR